MTIPLRNFTAIILWSAALLSCDAAAGSSPRSNASTFHHNFRWKAEDYFDDPQVVTLCHAIEANDLAEIDRSISAGADINTKGKGNMTPLLWAFPDNALELFTHLLKRGADPNIPIESDFNTQGQFEPGDSVTHLACRTKFTGYFEAVFAHGGDPNLIRTGGIMSGSTPLISVIAGDGPDKAGHVRVLIDKGADLNHINGLWETPAMAAAVRGHYDIALTLLQAGANPRIYKPSTNTKLVHVLALTVKKKRSSRPQGTSAYERLAQWLEDHGESLDTARSDIKRWQSWGLRSGEYRRKMDAEIAERIARDARATEATGRPDRE